MLNLRTSFLVGVFLVIFFFPVAAQPVISGGGGNKQNTGKPPVESTFTSVEGEFTISLPNDIRGYSGLRLNETAGLGVGASYIFQQPEARYIIGYINLAESVQSLKDAQLAEKIKAFQNMILGFELDDKLYKQSRKNGDLVVEGQVQDEYFFRYIRHGKRIYLLQARAEPNLPTSTIWQIFDSIRFISNKEIFARKIAEATPQSLPQTPVLKTARTDAEDDELKGRIRSIVEENEDLTGNWYTIGKVRRWENHYNPEGNLVKRIFYSNEGFPDTITVYGYIDGARVSDSGYIRSESSPVITVMTPGKAETKPRDERYDTKIVKRYDEKKRLSEEAIYRNNGDLIYKTVYRYDGNKVEELSYHENDDLYRREIRTFDAKGSEIESELFWNKAAVGSKYVYTYEKFDDRGNWTKRLVTGRENSAGGGKEQKYYEYRTIEYYP